MRPAELIALAYFVGFLMAAVALRRQRPLWKSAAALASIGVVAAVNGARWQAETPGALTVRDWWPFLILPLAYWTPAPLAGRPAVGLERWLARIDRQWPSLTRADGRPSRAFDALFEFSYLLVYPMVPAGFLAVGVTGERDAIDRFWPALFASVLPCYAMLAALPTRTPRALRADTAPQQQDIRRLNVTFLKTFGNEWNTFPSGHAAGAAAIAVLVARAGSPLALPFALLAAGIALGTVRGRYHYLADTALGVALGLAAGLQL